ncbi:hypothetical protein BEP19_15395 [Ammoniphilus oxalaticus]|uniref:DUF4352 domain-containing protein n=1 Tax=Ammoniphilus oxalaticus TaxID=66863 RepID=A0A419SDB0_9BACL|nr:hypothetical protein [Ammoniphilus oxalaticus]RKD21061.1 hypothetical protein BEP19_15395 [Ammoniphilus oxalaticus]
MIKKRLLAVLLMSIFISVVVGCGNSENEPVEAEVDEVGEMSDQEQKEQTSEIQEKGDEDQDRNDAPTSGRSTSNKGLPNDLEVNERIKHPTGVIMTLEKVSFEDDYIAVDFMIQNGYSAYVKLDLEGVELVDDTGFEYSFQPVDLRVGKNERMEGTLIFVGRLDDKANSLTLSFNSQSTESDEENANTQYPKIVFDQIQIER